MKNDDFLKILDNRIEKITALQHRKGDEYSRGGDRLSNFKRAAAMLQCHPARALLGAWSKHITSVLDMIDDLSQGKRNALPVWEEKINDLIIYAILLEAIVREDILDFVNKEKICKQK